MRCEKTLYVVYAFCLLYIISFFAGVDQHGCRIIVLTGPSCAGKSTLARFMQTDFPFDEWHIISFGLFRQQMLLEKAKQLELVPLDYFNNNNILLDQEVQKNIGVCEKSIAEQKKYAWDMAFNECDILFAEHVRMLTHENKNLIIDVPLYKKNTFSQLACSLQNCELFFVLVHVSFECLAERVLQRSCKTNTDYRYINQVAYRYALYYRSGEIASDDTLDAISVEAIRNFVVKWTSEQENFVFLSTKEDLADDIVRRLNAENYKKIFLIPRLQYDYVLDTSKYTPQECAVKVRCAWLKHRSISKFFANKADVLMD